MAAIEITTHPDCHVFARIGELREAWKLTGNLPEGMTDEEFSRLMDAAFNGPEEELRSIRPSTISGALAKVEFYRWYSEAAGSETPMVVGLEAASADLAALMGMGRL